MKQKNSIAIQGKDDNIEREKTSLFEKQISGEFLTIDEASSFLRITKSTLYTWVNQRKIPFRKHGGRVVFNRQELDDWSKKQSFAPILNEPNYRRGG